MEAAQLTISARSARATSLLAVGFGTTVAMWAVGYAGRIPAVMLPSPLILALLLGCLLGGGLVLGRYTGLGWPYGAAAGLVSGALNLLVLGSFLGGGGIAPSALLWIPGSILVAATLAGAGAQAGSSWIRREPPYSEWCAAFARVGIAAALLLLAVGGLVTSTETGLAVVDWPNSFGYNMFLYPFSRMTGGIYYEHAHRLFGALVGLTTLTLALVLQAREPNRWVRRLGWVALAMVVVQGVLGGLRVTGEFTLATSPEATRPNLALAMVHGVFGQLFFATLVAIGALTSKSWRETRAGDATPVPREDALLATAVVVAIVAQLTFGAAQRHFSVLLFPHILVGVTIVTPAALHLGFRIWGRDAGGPMLRRLGLGLAAAVGLQVALGFAAYAATGASAPGTSPARIEIVITTAHQWFGAVVLGLAVLVLCFCLRPDRPE